MGSQSWQVPVPAVPSQRAPEEVHSESSIAVSNGLKTPDLSLRSLTLGEYPRIFHSSQKRLVFPLTDPPTQSSSANTVVKDPRPWRLTHLQTPEDGSPGLLALSLS